MNTKLFWIVLAVIVFIGCAGTEDLEELTEAEIEYCEMVYLYHTSNGLAGWPDYKGTYNDNCKVKLLAKQTY